MMSPAVGRRTWMKPPKRSSRRRPPPLSRPGRSRQPAGNTIGGRGTVVSSVQPGGPAARAGISEGDVITQVNGQPTPNTSALSTVLVGFSPGQTVQVAFVRPNGGGATVSVTLGLLPG
jgi:S1-C subfamily serine protease